MSATLQLEKTLAEIAKMREETQKFVMEHRKLITEERKLVTEERKMSRERWWHPVVVSAALVGAGAALGAGFVRLI